ncbi:MAG: hypothetical protein P3X22_005280 [Thermoprotei archaeon]|nr:hypothetical protein [Thermoprotei archaeon]
MPPNGHMPQLVKAIAVSKPSREYWLEEELLDALIAGDESVRVERTKFPGVLLVLSERLNAHKVSSLASKMEFSFMSRLVPASRVLKGPGKGEVFSVILELLGGAPRAPLRVIVTVRGHGKRVVSPEEVSSQVSSLGFTVSRRAGRALAVESVDDLFIIAYGITRVCGLNCTLLYVD